MPFQTERAPRHLSPDGVPTQSPALVGRVLRQAGEFMDMLAWIGIALLIVVLIVGWLFADRFDAGVRGRLDIPRARSASGGKRDLRVEAPIVTGADVVLASRPMVESGDGAAAHGSGADSTMPLRDWLVHYHLENRSVWSDLAQDFLDTVAKDREVAAYFEDEPAMRRHFLTALIMAIEGGVTATRLDQLRLTHALVRDDHGQTVTERVFGSATGPLLEILRGKGVPEPTLEQVTLVLGRLREAIVAQPGPNR